MARFYAHLCDCFLLFVCASKLLLKVEVHSLKYLLWYIWIFTTRPRCTSILDVKEKDRLLQLLTVPVVRKILQGLQGPKVRVIVDTSLLGDSVGLRDAKRVSLQRKCAQLRAWMAVSLLLAY